MVLREKSNEDIFCELAFCLLTPQSKAICCWNAITALKRQRLLLAGDEGEIKRVLHCVRFHNKKALYVVAARELFSRGGKLSIARILTQFQDSDACRRWLVGTVKGLGYKEASHFLRNIGRGESLAILDRHILRNLALFGVIDEVPRSLSPARYLEIERKMELFAQSIRIPLPHLDLLLWYKETGEIFK